MKNRLLKRRPSCELCTRRRATHRTKRGVKVCPSCVADLKRDQPWAPADFKPLEDSP